MKWVLIIPDGCADMPIDALGGKTPLQAASIPAMDEVARMGASAEATTYHSIFRPGVKWQI